MTRLPTLAEAFLFAGRVCDRNRFLNQLIGVDQHQFEYDEPKNAQIIERACKEVFGAAKPPDGVAPALKEESRE